MKSKDIAHETQLVDELVVECVYKEDGCDAKLQRQCLATHLKDECQYSESGKVRTSTSKSQAQEAVVASKESPLSEERAENAASSEQVRPSFTLALSQMLTASKG